MNSIQNFLVLIILNSNFFIRSYGIEGTILKGNSNRIIAQKTDDNENYEKYHLKKCVYLNDCNFPSSNMFCKNDLCECTSDYKWDDSAKKCLRKCTWTTDCYGSTNHRHCNSGKIKKT
jgi:hypothetical protein